MAGLTAEHYTETVLEALVVAVDLVQVDWKTVAVHIHLLLMRAVQAADKSMAHLSGASRSLEEARDLLEVVQAG